MSGIEVRKLVRPDLLQLVDSFNMFKLDIMKAATDNQLVFHGNASSAITLDDATADGYGPDGYSQSALDLVNAERTAIRANIASYCNDDPTELPAHYGIDSINIITAPVATDFDSMLVLANDIKDKYNAHLSYDHQYEDTTNVITASDATNEASLITLVNQIKAKANAHFAAAMLSETILPVDP